jgi:hypothetical protein
MTKSPPLKYEFSYLDNCFRDSSWEGLPVNIADCILLLFQVSFQVAVNKHYFGSNFRLCLLNVFAYFLFT